MEDNFLDYSVSITLHNALQVDNTIFGDIIFGSSEQTNELINTIKTMYDYYDIGFSTITMFKRYLTNEINTKKAYYLQILNEYQKEFDYMQGYVSSQTDSIIESSNSENSNTRENDFIDLPNKITSSNYITSKENSNNSSNANYVNNRSNAINKKGGVNILEQKKQYLKYIRNVYYDFAKDLRNCFAIIY